MRYFRIARICADSPAIQKYPAPAGHAIDSTTSASRLVPDGASSQVTSAVSGR